MASSDKDVAKSIVNMQLKSGTAPTKGRRLKNTVDDQEELTTKSSLRRKLSEQKDKIGASNPPDGKRKFD